MQNVVIVGGGSAGVLLANTLGAKNFKITLIDKSPRSYYQPGLLDVAFGGSRKKIWRETARLLGNGITFINSEATQIDLTKKTVKTATGEYPYDYLVVATGTITDTAKISGLAEINTEFGDYHTTVEQAALLHKRLSEFTSGTVVVGQGGPVSKCPPSPLEGAFLAEEYLRKRGVRKNARIVFFTPYPRAYPAEVINDAIQPYLKARGIEVMPFFDLDRIDTKQKTISSIEGDTIGYDLPIIVPPFRGNPISFTPNVLDSDGFIKADKNTMKIEGFDNAFAVGDASNLPTSKSGVTAHLEALAVAEIIRGRPGRFDGRTNCTLRVDHGHALFVISDYDNPVVPVKPSSKTMLMEKMNELGYWMSLSGKITKFTDMYFKSSSPAKLNRKLKASRKPMGEGNIA